MSAAAAGSRLARVPLTASAIPAGLAAATVAAQIAYPLVAGVARDRLTVATVLVFFAASVSHAWVSRGAAFAGRLVAVCSGIGLIAELLGVWTGVPFGVYDYAGSLGWDVAGVPLVIPLAWTMMGYPALVVARRVTDRPVAGALFGAAALASWDLFLDPQMVAAGHWSWSGGGLALLGIPLTNFAGWYATALVMMVLLWPAAGRLHDGSQASAHGHDRRATIGNRAVSPPTHDRRATIDDRVVTPPTHDRRATIDDRAVTPPTHDRRATIDDRVPYVLYLWVYGSSVLAHAVFLDLPGSALVGGIGMGAVVAVFVRALRR